MFTFFGVCITSTWEHLSCCGHALVSKDTPHSVMLSIACIAMMYPYAWENFDGIKFWQTIQGNRETAIGEEKFGE